MYKYYNKTKGDVAGRFVTKVHKLNHEAKHTQFVYKSNSNQIKVDALLAKNFTKYSTIDSSKPIQVKSRTVWASVNSGCDRSFTEKVFNKICENTATDENECSGVTKSCS